MQLWQLTCLCLSSILLSGAPQTCNASLLLLGTLVMYAMETLGEFPVLMLLCCFFACAAH